MQAPRVPRGEGRAVVRPLAPRRAVAGAVHLASHPLPHRPRVRYRRGRGACANSAKAPKKSPSHFRGEVSCPQEDLHGLLRTARSLQIRGLVELERKREAEGFLCNSITGSPIKQVGLQGFGVGKSCTYTK